MQRKRDQDLTACFFIPQEWYLAWPFFFLLTRNNTDRRQTRPQLSQGDEETRTARLGRARQRGSSYREHARPARGLDSGRQPRAVSAWGDHMSCCCDPRSCALRTPCQPCTCAARGPGMPVRGVQIRRDLLPPHWGLTMDCLQYCHPKRTDQGRAHCAEDTGLWSVFPNALPLSTPFLQGCRGFSPAALPHQIPYCTLLVQLRHAAVSPIPCSCICCLPVPRHDLSEPNLGMYLPTILISNRDSLMELSAFIITTLPACMFHKQTKTLAFYTRYQESDSELVACVRTLNQYLISCKNQQALHATTKFQSITHNAVALIPPVQLPSHMMEW